MDDNITNLPNEIFVQLMKDLSYDDLQILTQVSKSNNDRIQSEAKRMLSRKYPDFLQFYDGRKSYLYYYYVIKHSMDEYYEGVGDFYPLCLVKQGIILNDLSLVKFMLEKGIKMFTKIYDNQVDDYDDVPGIPHFNGSISIQESLYRYMVELIMSNRNVSIEILDYLKNLYPGIFTEVIVPILDKWEIVGSELFNPRKDIVMLMYYKDYIDGPSWLLPGNNLYDWLPENSNWFDTDWINED